MNKKIILLLLTFAFTGCSVNDAYRLTQAAISNNPSLAFQSLAKSKATSYALNPKKLASDLKSLNNLIKKITLSWGKNNIKIPSKKEYVKYMQNYKSRANIDFDKGIVTVETIDKENAIKSLKNAIITTLLLPDDPRSVDLFGSGEVKLGATPYLYKEIKDDQNKNIRYKWRATRYANILSKKYLKEKNILISKKKVKVTYVEIPMVKDHASIRVQKFKPLVKKYAKKYSISENLIYAIIKTESNFNQFAVSNAGAYGLMQIVPSTAGIDSYKYITNKKWKPSKNYLFNANNNIKLGTAYLKILKTKYLKGIYNSVKMEYCMISAYNTGSGNVFKTFSNNKSKALNSINKNSTSYVYKRLINHLPYDETRRYLQKVLKNKKNFIKI